MNKKNKIENKTRGAPDPSKPEKRRRTEPRRKARSSGRKIKRRKETKGRKQDRKEKDKKLLVPQKLHHERTKVGLTLEELPNNSLDKKISVKDEKSG